MKEIFFYEKEGKKYYDQFLIKFNSNFLPDDFLNPVLYK